MHLPLATVDEPAGNILPTSLFPHIRTPPNRTCCHKAIHKKYKMHAEAQDAFDRAMREGMVRAVQVDPESDMASSSNSPFPPHVV